MVLGSIIAFWLFYSLIVSMRAGMMDFPQQGELALRRSFVAGAGVFITAILWQVLRLVDQQPLFLRVAIAAFAAVPAAFAIAAVNHFVFNIYDPASLMDIEKLRRADPASLSMMMQIAEIGLLCYFFLIAWCAFYFALGYASEVHLAERRTADFARAAQTAELRALRYQVNPHFLFNTLNSLSALVMAGRREEAEAMIMNLSTFYRTSLSGDPSGDVSLDEEIELQRRYLDIEAVRFPQRLQVEVDIPAPLGALAVPGLILQPIVENAIKHGVSRTSQPVVLAIRAHAEGDNLVIDISDSAPASATPARAGNGIGLANVRERLATRFGDAASLETNIGANGGYAVRLVLPMVGAA